MSKLNLPPELDSDFPARGRVRYGNRLPAVWTLIRAFLIEVQAAENVMPAQRESATELLNMIYYLESHPYEEI